MGVRSPASTWATGIFRKNADKAAAIAEVVSPWTIIQSGFSFLNISSIFCNIRAVTFNGFWSSIIMFRSWSGWILKKFKSTSTIWRCCAVSKIRVSKKSELLLNFFITGASFITSGRVPNTTDIFFFMINRIYSLSARL